MQDISPQPQRRPVMDLFVLMGLWFGGALLGAILVVMIGPLLGIGDFPHLLAQFREGEFLEYVPIVKVLSSVSSLCTFALPALLFAYIIHKPKHNSYLLINRAPGIKNLLLAIPLVVLTLPLALTLFTFNTGLLPDNYITKETMEIVNVLMQMDSVGDMLMNLFLFGVVAGVGEELFFRGGVQRILGQMSKNIHFAVWTAAILFSLIHGELQGFLPRALLGVVLGYAVVWTGNLWVSISMHVAFNSIQVFAQYFSEDNLAEIDPQNMEYPHWAATLVTTVLAGAFAYWLMNMNKGKTLSEEAYLMIDTPPQNPNNNILDDRF